MEIHERIVDIDEEQLKGLTVSYEQTVTERDIDDLGVVYYGNYSAMLDQARYLLCRAYGYPGYDEAREEGWLLPVLRYSLKVEKAARPGDTLEIRGWWHSIQGARARFAAEFYNKKTGELTAYGYTEHCFVDVKTFKPLRPNPAWKICFRFRNGGDGPLGVPAKDTVIVDGEKRPVTGGKIAVPVVTSEGANP